MKNLESKLQCELVKWFRLQYPKYAGLLFAVPNGGKRSVITASIMKREGALAGVADLVLAVPIDHEKVGHKYQGCHALFVEVKYGNGKQSESQIAFEKAVEAQGYHYEVITSFDKFKDLIDDYLK
jgi:hypothetical protein